MGGKIETLCLPDTPGAKEAPLIFGGIFHFSLSLFESFLVCQQRERPVISSPPRQVWSV